jgi:hypothetical protein
MAPAAGFNNPTVAQNTVGVRAFLDSSVHLLGSSPARVALTQAK